MPVKGDRASWAPNATAYAPTFGRHGSLGKPCPRPIPAQPSISNPGRATPTPHPCRYPLADLPVRVLGRLRANRVLRRPAPCRREHALAHPAAGRHRPRGGGGDAGEHGRQIARQRVADVIAVGYRAQSKNYVAEST